MHPTLSFNTLAPKVSIIISLFNKEDFISETIESVQSQSFSNWELIIIDDCSTDNSVSIFEPYLQGDKRIRFFQNNINKGANYGRNLGIRESTGKYIIFLDADDLLSTNCLAARLKVVYEKSDIDFCVFSMGIFREKPGDLNGDWIPASNNPLRDFLKHKLPWTISQPIWKKSFLLGIKGFDESFKRLQDVELHTRALLVEGVKFLQKGGAPDCYYRIDEKRINYENYELLSRYVQSAIQYYTKFFPLVRQRNLQNKLLGTIYRTYTRILHSYKTGEINRIELQQLERRLLNPEIIPSLRGFKKKIFFAGKLAALLPVRISGINWFISRIVEL